MGRGGITLLTGFTVETGEGTGLLVGVGVGFCRTGVRTRVAVGVGFCRMGVLTAVGVPQGLDRQGVLMGVGVLVSPPGGVEGLPPNTTRPAIRMPIMSAPITIPTPTLELSLVFLIGSSLFMFLLLPPYGLLSVGMAVPDVLTNMLGVAIWTVCPPVACANHN